MLRGKCSLVCFVSRDHDPTPGRDRPTAVCPDAHRPQAHSRQPRAHTPSRRHAHTRRAIDPLSAPNAQDVLKRTTRTRLATKSLCRSCQPESSPESRTTDTKTPGSDRRYRRRDTLCVFHNVWEKSCGKSFSRSRYDARETRTHAPTLPFRPPCCRTPTLLDLQYIQQPSLLGHLADGRACVHAPAGCHADVDSLMTQMRFVMRARSSTSEAHPCPGVPPPLLCVRSLAPWRPSLPRAGRCPSCTRLQRLPLQRVVQSR